MAVVYQNSKQVPFAFKGDITRESPTNLLDAQYVDEVQANQPLDFGTAVKLSAPDANNTRFIQAFTTGDTLADFYGIIVREKVHVRDIENPDLAFRPKVSYAVMRAGYIAVECKVGTPTVGGKVYLRITADVGKDVGDFEADADGANNVEINAEFVTSEKDANNITEIRLKGL